MLWNKEEVEIFMCVAFPGRVIEISRGSDRSTVCQDDKYVEEAYDLSERDNEEQ
jgi:hydrogenase maturation factor